MYVECYSLYACHVGLGEVLWSQGVDHLVNMMPNFINHIEDESKAPHIRDGFLMLFIYLPSIFKEKFTSFISEILPCILKVRIHMYCSKHY